MGVPAVDWNRGIPALLQQVFKALSLPLGFDV